LKAVSGFVPDISIVGPITIVIKCN